MLCRYSQALQRRLYLIESEKYRLVRNALVVEHQANPPDDWGEADILGASQVVEDEVGLGIVAHSCYLRGDENFVKERKGRV